MLIFSRSLLLATALSLPLLGACKDKTQSLPKNEVSLQVETSAKTPPQTSTHPAIKKLADLAFANHYAYDITRDLTTKLGPRQAGSRSEAQARRWALKTMREIGLVKVHNEPFKINGWARGRASAQVIAPYPQPLRLTALGGSVATPRGGITAPVVYFRDYEALLAAPMGSLDGKIAYISGRMKKDIDGKGYGPANRKRRNGASEAARRGAVATLIRSVGTDSHRMPHTGQMRYADGIKKIPIAALSNPDADQLDRIFELTEQNGKEVRIKMVLSTRDLGERPSGNVIGEIRGATKPDEIILIGAHLDSWDEGTGAIDDGAGVGIVLGAAKALIDSGLKPKRTIRVVLFGSEEIGLKGGFAYAKAHRDELDKHVLASESDFGAGRVYGLQPGKYEAVKDFVRAQAPQFAFLGIKAKDGETTGGPDINPLNDAGVPTIRLNQDGTDYFDLHHTPDDTFDKIDPEAMQQNVAAWATLIWLASQADTDFRDNQGE